MPKRGSLKQGRRAEALRASKEASARSQTTGRGARRKQQVGPSRGASWVGSKRPVLRFVLILGVLIVAFNACFYLWIANWSFFQEYLNVYAKVAAAVLTVLGDNVTAAGSSVASSRFSLSIAVGCDGVQPSAFFVFAVLAAPSSLSVVSRVPYVIFGLLLLSFLNLARIVSLYYTGVYFPEAFEVMHIEVWQAVFVFVPLILWISWSRRTIRTEGVNGDVPN